MKREDEHKNEYTKLLIPCRLLKMHIRVFRGSTIFTACNLYIAIYILK